MRTLTTLIVLLSLTTTMILSSAYAKGQEQPPLGVGNDRNVISKIATHIITDASK